ncbi:MAG: hypothetical protein LC800_19255 [Acidobacteria bacterium]|nr:hypothetical protein [Acidobacteriota bacterium]
MKRTGGNVRVGRGAGNLRARRARLAAGVAVACLLLAPAGLWTGTASAQRRGAGIDRRALAQAESYTGDRFQHLSETPRGARVASVGRPRAEMLAAIDRGLAELFAVARRHNYRALLRHSDYTVFIARADRVKNGDGRYSPDVAIGAAQYAGSDYDRGGYVYAAGIVSSFSPASFIIAEHDRDFGRVADVVRYEGEHLVLRHNDPARFRQTMDHSRGGSHPILQ